MTAALAIHSTSLSIATVSYSRRGSFGCGSSDGDCLLGRTTQKVTTGGGASAATTMPKLRALMSSSSSSLSSSSRNHHRPRERQRGGRGGGRRRLVVSSATSPRIDDVDLLVGDITVLWLFALFQKTSSVALSETFPGWLAPVTVDPASFASFLGESAWLISTWGAVATLLGAYELEDVLGKEEGEMREAVKGATITWATWCLPAGGGLFWLSNVAGLRSSFPPGVTLGTALGVMIAWRAYAKVIGLLGWWRADREVKSPKEDDDWTFLYTSLAGSAVLAAVAAALDFVFSGRGGAGGGFMGGGDALIDLI